MQILGIFPSKIVKIKRIRTPKAKSVTEQRHNPNRDCRLQAVVDLPDERKPTKSDISMLTKSRSMLTPSTGQAPAITLKLSVQDFVTTHCNADSDMKAELTAALIESRTDTALLYTVYAAKMANSKDEDVAIEEVVKTVRLAMSDAIKYSGQLMIAYGVKDLYELR
jgi:hypothetical protein